MWTHLSPISILEYHHTRVSEEIVEVFNVFHGSIEHVKICGVTRLCDSFDLAHCRYICVCARSGARFESVRIELWELIVRVYDA